jgi:hypothetical protein
MYLLPHLQVSGNIQQIEKRMEVHEGTGPVRISRDGRATKIECWRPMVAPDGQPVAGFDCVNFGEVNPRLTTQVISWPLAKWRIENNGQYVTFNVGVAMHQDGEVFDPDA